MPIEYAPRWMGFAGVLGLVLAIIAIILILVIWLREIPRVEKSVDEAKADARAVVTTGQFSFTAAGIVSAVPFTATWTRVRPFGVTHSVVTLTVNEGLTGTTENPGPSSIRMPEGTLPPEIRPASDESEFAAVPIVVGGVFEDGAWEFSSTGEALLRRLNGTNFPAATTDTGMMKGYSVTYYIVP